MDYISVPRELHGKKLFGYIIGYFGIFLNQFFINTYIFNFYIYTINLDSIMVLTGYALHLTTNAIFSIIFGVLSDKKRPSKYGKRRLFLLYGLPLWVITNLIIWMPPVKCSPGNSFFLPTALYFWIIGFLNSIFTACILSPHASMLPEQSETYTNRKKISVSITLCLIVASIIGLIPPLFIRSIIQTNQLEPFWWTESGEIITFFTPLVSLAFTIFAIISIIITFTSIDETFHYTNKNQEFNKISLFRTLKDMIKPLKDKKYRKFINVNLLINFALGIMGFLIIPFLDYVMIFRGINYYIYPIVSVFSKIGWFFIWKHLQEKKKILTSFKTCIIVCIIASSIILIFLFNNILFEIKVLLFILTVGFLLGSIYAFRLYSTPIAATLISEAAVDYKNNDLTVKIENISGAYMGLFTFTVSFGPAMANLILAFIFTGNNKSNELIIILVFASMALFFLISLFYLNKIHVKETK